MTFAWTALRKASGFFPSLVVVGIWLPVSARAHGSEELTAASLVGAWNFAPEIVAATVFVSIVYFRGMVRLRSGSRETERRRHLLFYSGVAAVFLSLQSPIDPMAERLFWMHQIQHLLLRMLGPMLIALSAPQGRLVAGMPKGMSRKVVSPFARNGPAGGIVHVLVRPDVAFTLFVAALYVWQIPRFHNAALLDDLIHYAMHVSMLLAGLLFWFMIFDRRDPPKGIPHPVRMLMLAGAILSNILLGAITTLKETVAYEAYDVLGRLFETDPLVDEVVGGLVIWIPGSMMYALAILIAMRRWGGHEDKSEMRRLTWSSSNSRALEWPETAEELRMKVSGTNRTVGLTLSAVSLSVFLVTVATVLTIHNGWLGA